MAFSESVFRNAYDLSDGYWQGFVVNNEDPEQLNRIQVSIDNLTDEIPTEHLPWYVILTHPTSGNNSHCSIPQVGSRVLVSFPNGDIYNGVVSFSIPSKPSA